MKKTALLLSSVLIFSGCEQMGALIGKDEASKKSMAMPPQMVKILTAKKEDVPLSFTYPARIVSNEDVNIRSRVAGVLVKKLFDAGQRIKRGDRLYVIDPEVYKARYNVQVANLSVAKANYSQAQKEYKRTRALYLKKATSQKNYDNAHATYEIAKANVAQAEALKDSARIDYGYTNVIAPFDGVVSDGLIDVGEYVPQNTPLVRLTQTDPVYAEFYIPDVESFNFQKNIENNLWSNINSSATVTYGGKDVVGKVVFIDQVVDAKNGSVKAKAEISNKDNAIPVGSFAKISIDGFSQKNAFKIPTIALQQDLATTFLYVAQDLTKEEIDKMPKDLPPHMIASSVVKMVPVKIDYQTDKDVLVSGGLKEGDKIIMNNYKKIRQGAKVKIVGVYGQEDKKMEKK